MDYFILRIGITFVFMKYIISFVSFFILVCLTGCDTIRNKQSNIQDFIPEKAHTIVKINNFEDNKAALASNDLLFPVLSESTLAALIQNIHPQSESLLCISKNDSKNNYTFITHLQKVELINDSIIKTKNETNSVKKIVLNDTPFYTFTKDSIIVIGSSEKEIKAAFNKKTLRDKLFKRALKIADNKGISIISKANKLQYTDSAAINFAKWMCLNTVISSGGITATGVAIPQDSIPQISNLFKGQTPQTTRFLTVLPADVTEAFSFTYSDFDVLQNNITANDSVSIQKKDAIFNLVNEVAVFSINKEKAIAIKSLDIQLAYESLVANFSEKNFYKDVAIYHFLNPELFKNTFSPLVKATNFKFAFQLGDFFIFTKTQETAQHIITSYKNELVFAKSNNYKNLLNDISSSSSLFIVQNGEEFATSLSKLTGIQSVSKKVIKQFPLAITQVSFDRDFAHLNLVCKEVSLKNQSTSSGVTETASISLKNTIALAPAFFTNHITKGKDIVVQDIDNVLYLISNNGKILWKKTLNNKIIGEIKEVDILKNGKKQLAFVTKNKLYVLDRNGKPVKPFPISFTDNITQPLAIFDYDNNRKYRFAITQGNKITLFDSKGKKVKGFTFSKTKSDIVLPPTHIRIANKDYIVIAEQNGKLHILNRTGKTRINLSKKFDFSDNPIVKEGNNFVVIGKNNTKHSIDTKGRVVSKKLKVSGTYYFTVNGRVKATLDENLLRINGKLVALPYGIYTQPLIFNSKGNSYISVTDTQEKKIYLFTRYAKPVQGFPVYGISGASLATGKGRLLLVTQTDDATVTVYRIK